MIEWLIFIPACFALNLAFGPNNLLSLTHGARGGVSFAVQAGTGRILAFVPMIVASALGLGLLLAASATVFNVVKIVGAVYLIWLGIRILLSATATAPSKVPGQGLDVRRAFRQECLVALSNPKAILVFAAFFPQFIVVDQYWMSYALLGTAFLAMELIAILVYAAAGRYAVRVAANRLPWFQRVSGAGMIAFGCLLLFSPNPNRSG
ncbi:MAG: LysE family translocator [Pseudomonadota bacterium]